MERFRECVTHNFVQERLSKKTFPDHLLYSVLDVIGHNVPVAVGLPGLAAPPAEAVVQAVVVAEAVTAAAAVEDVPPLELLRDAEHNLLGQGLVHAEHHLERVVGVDDHNA